MSVAPRTHPSLDRAALEGDDRRGQPRGRVPCTGASLTRRPGSGRSTIASTARPPARADVARPRPGDRRPDDAGRRRAHASCARLRREIHPGRGDHRHRLARHADGSRGDASRRRRLPGQALRPGAAAPVADGVRVARAGIPARAARPRRRSTSSSRPGAEAPASAERAQALDARRREAGAGRGVEPLTADEVGQRIGVARVTARRYLEYLDVTGAANVEREYLGPGPARAIDTARRAGSARKRGDGSHRARRLPGRSRDRAARQACAHPRALARGQRDDAGLPRPREGGLLGAPHHEQVRRQRLPADSPFRGYAVRGMVASEHVSTHVDAVWHFNPDRPDLTIDRLPWEHLITPAAWIDLSDVWPRTPHHARRRTAAHSSRPSHARAGDDPPLHDGHRRVLGRPVDVSRRLSGLDEEASRWLLDQGIVNLGTDAVTTDTPSDTSYPNHRVHGERCVVHTEMVANITRIPEHDGFLGPLLPAAAGRRHRLARPRDRAVGRRRGVIERRDPAPAELPPRRPPRARHGAGRGLGRACALALAEAGASVRSSRAPRDELEHVAAEIAALGSSADVVVADVTDPAEVEPASRRRAAHDDLWICVNNAGANRPGPTVELALADWDLVRRERPRHLPRHPGRRPGAARPWPRRTSHQHVVADGSRRLPGRAAYCAAKHAVNGLTKALAVEWAPLGITVNAVAPTFVETPLTIPMLDDAAFRDDVLAASRWVGSARSRRSTARRRLPRLSCGGARHGPDARRRRRLDRVVSREPVFLKRPALERGAVAQTASRRASREMLRDLEREGMDAVRRYSRELDGWDPPSFQVSDGEIQRASAGCPTSCSVAIAFAQEQIRGFAERAAPRCSRRSSIEPLPGVVLGHRHVPVDTVGSYVPGGRVPLLASSFMTVRRAEGRRRRRVVACAPPREQAGSTRAMLHAMATSGADAIFAIGGVAGARRDGVRPRGDGPCRPARAGPATRSSPRRSASSSASSGSTCWPARRRSS